MRTLEDALKVVKSLFSAPLGSFPRGGIETALNVRLSTSPTSITLISEHGLSVKLKRSEDIWHVIFLGESHEYPSLDRAVYAMLEPIIRDEISHRL
tara:strand:+ start:1045 stop:1332 length:288 start_codon:yes stop_codon:yes gene_type:complete